MDEILLTREQTRNFILLKQGLLGPKRFVGKAGIMQYFQQAGCIQFDPVDVCGRNADLTLQSRVEGYEKKQLYELLYESRKLIDYFDKNMSIFSIEDWPCFRNTPWYMRYDEKVMQTIYAEREKVTAEIRKKGSVTTKDLDLPGTVFHWFWTDVKLAKAALETLYNERELVIHHKTGVIKSYALAEDVIPPTIFQAEYPFANQIEYLSWRVLRRIGAIGCLWNKHSDAFLFIDDLKTDKRLQVFAALEKAGKIIRFHVEGLNDNLFCQSEDRALLEQAMRMSKISDRVEFIAPLDPMIWDRKLIKAIFDYDYTWEIYSLPEKRVYGYYVLPVLYRNQLIGRIEMTCERKQQTLHVLHFWPEIGWKQTITFEKAFQKAIGRFAAFNQCPILQQEATIPGVMTHE
jgi:hypothetical protein